MCIRDRGEGAQRVLDAVAELPRNFFGNVDRVLRHEIDADALRSDQAHDLFDLVDERGRRIVEQQMRFVKEEDELRLVGIADLGKRLEHLGQQPEQEGRIKLRTGHQLVGGKDVHIAAALVVALDHICLLYTSRCV